MPLPSPGDDTGLAAREMIRARWRAMTPPEKLRLVREITRTVEILARSGLRSREPTLNDAEVFFRLARQRLGADLATRAYGAAVVGH